MQVDSARRARAESLPTRFQARLTRCNFNMHCVCELARDENGSERKRLTSEFLPFMRSRPSSFPRWIRQPYLLAVTFTGIDKFLLATNPLSASQVPMLRPPPFNFQGASLKHEAIDGGASHSDSDPSDKESASDDDEVELVARVRKKKRKGQASAAATRRFKGGEGCQSCTA